jgi:hypothetical protein
MDTNTLTKKLALQDYKRLVAGERLVFNTAGLEALNVHCGNLSRILEVASCLNRNRIGTQDQYVVWLGDANKPEDLEFRGLYAIGSV